MLKEIRIKCITNIKKNAYFIIKIFKGNILEKRLVVNNFEDLLFCYNPNDNMYIIITTYENLYPNVIYINLNDKAKLSYVFNFFQNISLKRKIKVSLYDYFYDFPIPKGEIFCEQII